MSKANNTVPPWVLVIDGKIALRAEKAGEFFDVDERTIRNWDAKANGTLRIKRGWYDIKAIMDWRSGQNAESDAARKLKAEADLKEEQATMARIEREILEGKYLSVDEVYTEWARRVSEVKSGLLALSKKVAAQFSDADIRIEVENILSDEIYDLLSQYARKGKYTPSKARKSRKVVQ